MVLSYQYVVLHFHAGFLTIYYAYTTDYQNQGRYLLPALIPLMYYMTKGFRSFRKSASEAGLFRDGW